MDKKKLSLFIGSHLLGHYINGNHSVTLFDDGTKHRATGHWEEKEGKNVWVKDDQDHFYFDFPENFDIKITDFCDPVEGRPDGGICSYCHENSSPSGKHGDLHQIEPMLRSLQAGTECACLRGSTIVHTPSGSKLVKDLVVGDKIFNSCNGISAISKIVASNKPVYALKFNRGLYVESSEDHPFMSNGKQIEAIKLPNHVIDTIGDIKGTAEIPVIDMAKYIHTANPSIISSRGGKIYGDNEIRLTNASDHSVRYVNFDTEFAYLYGWFIAEGSRSSLTMCSNELSDAQHLGDIWERHTGMNYSIQVNDETHSLNLELRCRTFTKHLMFDALNVGHGAKFKNLSFLYSVTNKEIIRSALLGVFMGDGCFRTRTYKRRGKEYHAKIISLKTTSQFLAYDVMYLLKKWFNITASVNHGLSKRGRPIDDRILPDSAYYMVEIYDNVDQNKLFPDLFPLVSKNRNYKRRQIKCVSCTPLDITEPLYDITLDGDIHTFPINGYMITHNCGGGNALAHPDLLWMLQVLKEQKVVANLTVNQRHLQKYREMLLRLVSDNLIHGIGISLTDSTNETDKAIIDELGKNVVIHVIAGIFAPEDVPFVKNRKMLVLGYKDLRRGHSLLEHRSDSIKANIQWLKEYLPTLKKETKLISFDCLGIEQIDPKTVLDISDERFDMLFQGSDTDVFDAEGRITCSTMYIDVPNMKVARMSTAALDKRYDFTGSENISDLLKMTTQGW